MEPAKVAAPTSLAGAGAGDESGSSTPKVSRQERRREERKKIKWKGEGVSLHS
jgi:hypothetical protein